MKNEVMSCEGYLDEDLSIDHSISILNNRIDAKKRKKRITKVLNMAYELDGLILNAKENNDENKQHDIKRLFTETNMEELTIACASVIEMNTNRDIPEKEFLDYCITMMNIIKSNNSYNDKFKLVSSEVLRCLTRELFPSLYC